MHDSEEKAAYHSDSRLFFATEKISEIECLTLTQDVFVLRETLFTLDHLLNSLIFVMRSE